MEPNQPGPHEPGTAWRYDALAYTFAGAILLFAGLGYVLDRWWGTRPLMIIIATLTGAGLGMAWVYAKVRQDERDSASRRGRSDSGSG